MMNYPMIIRRSHFYSRNDILDIEYLVTDIPEIRMHLLSRISRRKVKIMNHALRVLPVVKCLTNHNNVFFLKSSQKEAHKIAPLSIVYCLTHL